MNDAYQIMRNYLKGFERTNKGTYFKSFQDGNMKYIMAITEDNEILLKQIETNGDENIIFIYSNSDMFSFTLSTGGKEVRTTFDKSTFTWLQPVCFSYKEWEEGMDGSIYMNARVKDLLEQKSTNALSNTLAICLGIHTRMISVSFEDFGFTSFRESIR